MSDPITDGMDWALFFADQVSQLSPAEQARRIAEYSELLASNQNAFPTFQTGVGWVLSQLAPVGE